MKKSFKCHCGEHNLEIQYPWARGTMSISIYDLYKNSKKRKKPKAEGEVILTGKPLQEFVEFIKEVEKEMEKKKDEIGRERGRTR